MSFIIHDTANTLVGHFGARCDFTSFSWTPLNCSSSSSSEAWVSSASGEFRDGSVLSPLAKSVWKYQKSQSYITFMHCWGCYFVFCTSTTIMHRPSPWQKFLGQFTIIVCMNNVESYWCSRPHTYWTMHNNFVQMCQNPTAQSTPLKTLGKSKIGYMELIAYISSNYMRILPVAAERTFLTSWNQWERLAPAKLCSILINVSLTFYNVKRRYYQYIRASLWHFWVR